MAAVHHRVSIDAPVARVFEALSSAEAIGTWWDKQTATRTDRGLVLEHNPGPEHGVVKLRVVELVPNRKIEWECISTHPKSSPASAWTDTHFVFELTEREALATLDFRQKGYPEHSEFYGSNKSAWAQVLENLKRVVESGLDEH